MRGNMGDCHSFLAGEIDDANLAIGIGVRLAKRLDECFLD